jgi:hypothetical protein
MKYLLFIVLLVAILITAGCISGNKETVVSPTPQIIYVTVTVTPTSIPTINPVNIQSTESSSTPIKSSSPIPRYFVGDLINSDDISKGKWVILNYIQGTDQYELDQIYKNPDSTWGFRIPGSSMFQDRAFIEKNLPLKFGHLNVDQIKFDNFDNYLSSDTKIKTPLNNVNIDLRYNAIRDLVTDGKKLKDVADKEYSNLNPNDEYAKYLFSVSKLGNDLNLWGTAYRNNQKEVALGYAGDSLKEIQDIDVILHKMESSDRYFSFSESIQTERDFFEEMKGNIIDSKDYTSYWI